MRMGCQSLGACFSSLGEALQLAYNSGPKRRQKDCIPQVASKFQ
jgi:hypothetical protein